MLRLPRALIVPVALLCATLLAATLPLAADSSHPRADNKMSAAPEQVGLSSRRLERIGQRFQAYVDNGEIVGALGMISRRGKLAYLETWGQRDRENQLPLTDDTIFRIYSMSKPITSVAVMMLYEDGHFFLNDPVAKFLPELARLEILAADGTRTKARRPITIRDLLRHTSGLTYGFFGNTGVDKLYRDNGILVDDANLAELVTKLGGLPLLYEPGTRWHYSLSTDVLGRLVEVVSGQKFEDFLHQRIFVPLAMDDTSFTVPKEKASRFAQLYAPEGTGDDANLFLQSRPSKTLEPAPEAISQTFQVGATLQSGGGGLVSTAADYMRFCLMLLHNGQLPGSPRLLSRKSVELMRADHLGDKLGMPFGGPGNGFGLGFSVVTDPGQVGELTSKGQYSWGGAAGTRFWIDPEEELIGIFMIQIMPHTGLNYGREFRMLTYQAIAD